MIVAWYEIVFNKLNIFYYAYRAMSRQIRISIRAVAISGRGSKPPVLKDDFGTEAPLGRGSYRKMRGFEP
jgi:hypothetical protein